MATSDEPGEIRRLTILFADLVDSTKLSTRVEPETYRLLVGRYRERTRQIIDRFGGHVGSTKGDGLLAVFGHPAAHEDDVRRAVHAGLEITRDVANTGFSQFAGHYCRTDSQRRIEVRKRAFLRQMPHVPPWLLGAPFPHGYR